MSKFSPSNSPCSEEQLVALLATLRVEPVKEADFEGRFLCEFHERVAREAVCCPARRHLLAHLMQMLSNFGRGRLAFGASTLCLGVVAVGYAMYPAGQAGVGTAAATVAVDRNAAPLLIPALSNDLAECTSIRVESSRPTFEVSGVTITRGQYSTVIEVPNVQQPAQHHRQGGYISLPASSVRYAF